MSSNDVVSRPYIDKSSEVFDLIEKNRRKINKN